MIDLLEKLDAETNKCINCGFCEAVCPTLPASGFSAIMGARGRVNLARSMIGEANENGSSNMHIADSFYSCLDCYACLDVCPAGVNAGQVSETAREIIATGFRLNENQQKPLARMIVSNTMRYFNPLGVREKCADWASGLRFNQSSEMLLYTGNMYQIMAYTVALKELSGRFGSRFVNFAASILADHGSLTKLVSSSYERETKKVLDESLRNIVELLKLKGLEVNYLGEEEPYSGALLHDLGYTSQFEEYAKRVTTAFKANGARTIVTVDPHTYRLLRFNYPEVVADFDFQVTHYLDFLTPEDFAHGDEEFTYHEPCLFVTRGVTYGAPLKLLSKVASVKLPMRHGKRTFCCGGPDELLFDEISAAVSKSRFAQLKETGSPKIATACPVCFVNLAKDDSVFDLAGILLKGFSPQR